jgi:predicted esterase
MRQWYDGSGDWEPEARGNMRRSVEHILALVRAEVQLLGGDASKVVLAGMSQGCAMALTCFLLWEGDPLCAIVGMCGFMPITAPLTRILDEEDADIEQDAEDGFVFESDPLDEGTFEKAELEGPAVRSPVQQVIDALWEEVELPGAAPPSPFSFRSTPVFLGHGVLDDQVSHLHTREAMELLERLGVAVDFRTYSELAHWYSAEMLSDIISFLADNSVTT